MSLYSGKNILITGATGQLGKSLASSNTSLGKVVFEKLIRSFPDIGTIYLAIRAKSDDEAYNRYKSEIKDSQICDLIKIQSGMKHHRKLLRRKVKLLPLDLQQSTLKIDDTLQKELQDKLHIIINCASIVDFDSPLDIQTDVNVSGPLNLMKLAEQCSNLQVFVQVSTTFAICEKTGFIDEKLFKSSSHKWQNEYETINGMS